MKTKLYVFAGVVFLYGALSFAEAPPCDPNVMRDLLKMGQTVTLRKVNVATGATAATSTLTFSPNGSDLCRGTLSQGAANFLATGVTSTTSGISWRTLFSFEYVNSAGKTVSYAFVFFVDPGNGGGAGLFTRTPGGGMNFTSCVENFYFTQD